MSKEKSPNNNRKDVVDRIFCALDVESRGSITKKILVQALLDRGIEPNDVRIRQTAQGLEKYTENEKINATSFRALVSPHITLIEKALTGNLVIPDFRNFVSFLTNIYNRTLQNSSGNEADSIPQLAGVNPKHYALSVCTVDGQRFSLGDYHTPYLARSTAKPLNYCMAFREYDDISIHKLVGREQKERGFDHLMLNQEGLPHNPLSNAGALLIGSLLGQKLKPEERFARIREFWRDMAGGIEAGWNKEAFLSEQRVADIDRAVAYFMQYRGLFSSGADVVKHLEFLWRCLAIETTTEAQAVIAGTLANAGVCPTSEREVLKSAPVKHCLSIMSIAGMKDYSSEYAFTIGLPAVSGTSGALMIVVPDVMGIAIWSPRIDANGNCARGLDFSRKLIERFNFHAYDSAIKNISKIDPRFKKNETKMNGVMAVTSAASIGDLDELNRLYSAGVDLSEGEYDKRTGIHLSASEGHIDAVKFFIEKNCDVNPKDRWGGTPLADAKREGHKAVQEFLKKHGGIE